MNEQTNKLIRDLAEKLGTTTGHLWSVLIRQAPLSTATELTMDLVILGLLAWAFRFVQRKTTVPIKKGYNSSNPDWDNEGKFVAWLVYTLLLAVGVIGTAYDMQMIVAGFFNPEYWALKQIIK